MRATFEINAGAAVIDVRDTPREEDYRPCAGVPIGGHECPFKLQQRAVELALPCRFQEGDVANHVTRLAIYPHIKLIDLGPDDDLCLTAFEFRAEREVVAVRGECGGGG